VGDQLVGRLGARAAREAASAATPAPAERLPPTLAHFDDDELEDEAYDGNDLAQRELIWRRAEAFVLERARAARRRLRTHDIQFEFRWGAVAGVANEDHSAPIAASLSRQAHFRRTFTAAAAGALGLLSSGPDESDAEEESRERLELLALSPLPGRCVCARLRVNGNEHDEVWPPEMRPGPDFRQIFEARMWELASSRAASSWLAYAADLVAGITVVAWPDQPAFGQRVETPVGPGGAIIHARAEARPAGDCLAMGAAAGATAARLQRLQGLRQAYQLNAAVASWGYAGSRAYQTSAAQAW